MLGYISTSPLHNPLFLPINSRFATHPMGISESSASTFAASHHNEKSPASAVSDCCLFSNCGLHRLPTCNGDLIPTQGHTARLPPTASPLSNSRVQGVGRR